MGELTAPAAPDHRTDPTRIPMKPHQPNIVMTRKPSDGRTSPTRGSRTALVMALHAIAASSGFAQSAANFDTKGLGPEAPAAKEEKAAKPVAKETAPASTTPSRQVGPGELDSYVTSLCSVFSSRERALDPFGQLQDPDAKPIITAPVAGVKRPQVQATPFADIIRLIVVTTIMPGEKRFLVGTRSIKQGDQIPLSFRGKQIRVQITEVTSQQIAFRNLENGDVATRKLDMLPVGMTPGNNGISAPGMTLDRPNSPIELETETAENVP